MTEETIELIDFNKSYLTWLTKDNSYGRFNIEAVCEIEDLINKATETYYLLSTVMACDVYGKKSLFRNPSYTFTAIFSSKEFKRIRNYTSLGKIDIDYGAISDAFKSTEIRLNKSYCRRTEINHIGGLIKDAECLISCVDLVDYHPNYTVKIIFPIKHINYRRNHVVEFQMETGMVILPNYLSKSQILIKDISLAYIAFNSLDKVQIHFQTSDHNGEIEFNTKEKIEQVISLETVTKIYSNLN